MNVHQQNHLFADKFFLVVLHRYKIFQIIFVGLIPQIQSRGIFIKKFFLKYFINLFNKIFFYKFFLLILFVFQVQDYLFYNKEEHEIVMTYVMIINNFQY